MKKLIGPDPGHLTRHDAFNWQVLNDFKAVAEEYDNVYSRAEEEYRRDRHEALLLGVRLPTWEDRDLSELPSEHGLHQAGNTFHTACGWLQAEIDRVRSLYEQELERQAQQRRAQDEQADPVACYVAVLFIIALMVAPLLFNN